MIHPASLDNETLLKNCEVTRTRRGGPGGQHRNKVETAVVVVHNSSGVSGQASELRSQADNLQMAVRRLKVNLAIAVRTPVDSARIPSSLWQERSHGQRIRVSTEHADFPAILAEALDFLDGCECGVPEASRLLGVTSSQLLRLVRSEPAAWTWLNRRRADLGLGLLH